MRGGFKSQTKKELTAENLTSKWSNLNNSPLLIGGLLLECIRTGWYTPIRLPKRWRERMEVLLNLQLENFRNLCSAVWHVAHFIHSSWEPSLHNLVSPLIQRNLNIEKSARGALERKKEEDKTVAFTVWELCCMLLDTKAKRRLCGLESLSKCK